VERTDGVPLFIEELTKTVLEGTSPRGRSAVPATLQASLLARFDRLPAARQVAQIGAAIGRDFSHALLAEAGGLPEARLARGLSELVDAGLIVVRGSPPEATYTFKHALVQDVAYQSLPRSRRGEIHAAIVAACEKAARFDIEPGVLAHHSAEAGLIAKAMFYYQRAAERSMERAAVPEMRRQLERGLAFAASLPEGAERNEFEVELLLALATALETTAGMSNAEAGLHFERASLVARRNPARPQPLARALWGQFTNVLVRGEVAPAREFAQQLFDAALACDEVHTHLAARAAMGIALYYQGHFDSARQHLLHHRTILDAQPEAGQLDWRTVTAGSAFLALTLACLGYPDQAKTQLDKTIALASRKGSFAIAYSLSVAVRVLIVLRDDDGLRKHATTLVTLAQEKGFRQFLNQGLCALGWLEAKIGAGPDGLHRLISGLAGMFDLKVVVSLPFYRSLLADALPMDDRQSGGLAALDSALELSERTKDAWFNAELHRMRGEMLTNPIAAKAELRRALRMARRQSARLFELRAAIGLSRLLEKQGKYSEAQHLVAPVYGWFTEGSDTPDLRDARQLLDRLRSFG
jgi:tetratricopeptide (TPR) repeat protein